MILADGLWGKVVHDVQGWDLGHFFGLMKKRHPRRITRRLCFSFDRVEGSSQFQWDSTAAMFFGLVLEALHI